MEIFIRMSLKLVQEQGMRATLEKQVQSNLDNAKDEMMKACRRCTSEFGDEWVKRMHKQLKIDDFVAVVVRVYEKYLDDNQVREMIALTIARKESKPAEPSPALKEKLASIMVAMQSEIIGGCAQVGARTGGEVGQQIEKEHPEYMRPVDASEKN